MKIIDVQMNYTVSEVAQLFEHARQALTQQQFEKWVDDFWTRFSQSGGTSI